MKNNKISDLTNELLMRLKNIYDDRDYIIGVLSIASREDDKQKLIDFIDAGEDVDYETVTVMAIELSRSHSI